MDDLTQWKAKRLAALTAPDGWLNLTDRVEIPQARSGWAMRRTMIWCYQSGLRILACWR